MNDAGASGGSRGSRPLRPPPSHPGQHRRAWLAELAWLPGVGVLPDVLIEAAGDRFTKITPYWPGGTTPRNPLLERS